MRVIIAGSRDIEDAKLVHDAVVASKFSITEVVSGGARGVDLLGLVWVERVASAQSARKNQEKAS